MFLSILPQIAVRQCFRATWADPEGGGDTGGPDPLLEKLKAFGFLCKTGTALIPCNITKLASKHSMLGHHRPTAKSHLTQADDGLLIVVF